MAAKQMKFDVDARNEIAAGLSQLARAVKATLGPRGRNVVIQKSYGSPRITKDGVTVSKEVELPQPFENMGAKIINMVASKTGDVAGDGTTTATVLAEAIMIEGLKWVTSGVNPVQVQRGIIKAAEVAADAITAQSKKVKGREDYKRVATISANGDEHIGNLMADAMEKVGKEGVITVDEGKSTESVLEYTEGMEAAKVGWGRVDIGKLREFLQLHTANEDISQRTSYIARAQSSNLLIHILQSMEQEAASHPVTGALTRPGDRLLILVGHDTNLANIAGALGLSWLIDGRRDDTPPGGALVLELWKVRDTEEYSVRTFYEAQTLDQMRNATPLSVKTPPERVPVFVPGCSQADGSCKWNAFQQTVRAGYSSAFVE